MQTAWLNIVLFAGAFNLLAVLACATGMLGPIGAAFTHQLSSFCVMMNSLRLLRVGKSSIPSWRLDITPLRSWLRSAARVFTTIPLRSWLRYGVIGSAFLLVLNGVYAVRPDEVVVIDHLG